VLTTCQPSTVWCIRERLPAAAAQPAKVRQSCSATDLFILFPLRRTLIQRIILKALLPNLLTWNQRSIMDKEAWDSSVEREGLI
jgi:hypothetical protein